MNIVLLRALRIVIRAGSDPVSWPTLAAIVDDCRHRFHARQIVIRWHPSRLDPVRSVHVLGDLSGIVQSPTTALTDVASRCDWVIADENSRRRGPFRRDSSSRILEQFTREQQNQL